MTRVHRASRRRSKLFVATLLGVLTTLAVAWSIAIWSIPREVPDPYVQPIVGGAANYTHYVMSVDPTHPPPTIDAGPRRPLRPGVSNESIAAVHAFLSTAPASRGFWCFTHRVFKSVGQDRIAMNRHSAFWGLSEEFFSIENAMYSSPDVFARIVEHFGNTPLPSQPTITLVERTGWPFRAFSGQVRIREPFPSDPRLIDSEWSIPLPYGLAVPEGLRWLLPSRGSTESEASCRFLPIRPLWTGLVGNTLFFAGVWSLVLFGPAFVRRRFRRRRNLCPRCAYDLHATPANSPCPECGTPPR